MNSNSSFCSDSCKTMTAWFIGVVGSFLIVGVLTWMVVRQNTDTPDTARAAERARLRAEIDATTAAKLHGPLGEAGSYSMDPAALGKGNKVYHMPVARALTIAAEEWKNPAEGRAKLIQRFDDSQKAQSFE